MTNAGPQSSERIFFPQNHSAGFFWGQLDDQQKAKVLEDVADEAAERFQAKLEQYVDSTGLRKPRGKEMLSLYRLRSPGTWAEMQAAFPHEYTRQMRQWRQLEQADMDKDEASKAPLPFAGPGPAMPLPAPAAA